MTSSITGTATLTGYLSNGDLYKVTYNKPIIGDIQWRLTASTIKRNSCDKLDVGVVCLQRNNASDAWFCDAEIEFKCPGAEGKMIIKNINHCFKNSSMRCKVENFCQFAKLANACITVDAHITLKPRENLSKVQLTDFGIPRNIDDEIVLLVGDKKLYVNKYLLMFHSPLFREVLSYEGIEKKLIEITDVKYEDMVAFLRYLSLEKYTITHENIKGFLTLADRYDVRNLMVYCETALMNTNKITTVEKLCLADKYKLKALQREVIQNITKADIEKMFEDIKTYNLASETKDALLVKVCMKNDKSRIKPYSEMFYEEYSKFYEGLSIFVFLILILLISFLIFYWIFKMFLMPPKCEQPKPVETFWHLFSFTNF